MNQERYLQAFKDLAEKKYQITLAKNSDYAHVDDAFQNFKLCEKLGISSVERGMLVRMMDKVQRISNLINKPNAVLDEKVEDTLLDLSNYADILYIWLKNKEVDNSIQ